VVFATGAAMLTISRFLNVGISESGNHDTATMRMTGGTYIGLNRKTKAAPTTSSKPTSAGKKSEGETFGSSTEAWMIMFLPTIHIWWLMPDESEQRF